MIPYYDMNEIHKPLKDEFMSQVKELLDTNNFVFGTDKFEEEFAEYTGALNIPPCNPKGKVLFFDPIYYIKIKTEDYRGNNEKILVVDDVKDQRELVKEMLEKLGYRVMTVSSGKKAINYTKSHKSDLIILDMIMAPGIDGLETYQQIIKIQVCFIL